MTMPVHAVTGASGHVGRYAGSPAAGPRRAAGRGEAPPAACQARITAAAAAGRGQAV